MISKRLLSQVANLKKMNSAQITTFIITVYEEGYKEGLQKYDDAVIITEEEARELIPSDMVDKLLMFGEPS